MISTEFQRLCERVASGAATAADWKEYHARTMLAPELAAYADAFFAGEHFRSAGAGASESPEEFTEAQERDFESAVADQVEVSLRGSAWIFLRRANYALSSLSSSLWRRLADTLRHLAWVTSLAMLSAFIVVAATAIGYGLDRGELERDTARENKASNRRHEQYTVGRLAPPSLVASASPEEEAIESILTAKKIDAFGRIVARTIVANASPEPGASESTPTAREPELLAMDGDREPSPRVTADRGGTIASITGLSIRGSEPAHRAVANLIHSPSEEDFGYETVIGPTLRSGNVQIYDQVGARIEFPKKRAGQAHDDRLVVLAPELADRSAIGDDDRPVQLLSSASDDYSTRASSTRLRRQLGVLAERHRLLENAELTPVLSFSIAGKLGIRLIVRVRTEDGAPWATMMRRDRGFVSVADLLNCHDDLVMKTTRGIGYYSAETRQDYSFVSFADGLAGHPLQLLGCSAMQ